MLLFYYFFHLLKLFFFTFVLNYAITNAKSDQAEDTIVETGKVDISRVRGVLLDMAKNIAEILESHDIPYMIAYDTLFTCLMILMITQ